MSEARSAPRRSPAVPKGHVLRTGKQIMSSFDLMNANPVEHGHADAGKAFVQFVLRQTESMPQLPPKAQYPSERVSFFVDPKINQVLRTPNVNSFDFEKDNERNWLSGKRGAFTKQSRFVKGRSALDRHQTPDHRQSKYRWENEEGMVAGLPKQKITGAVVHRANWDRSNIPEVVRTKKMHGEENKVVKSSAKEGVELTEEEARRIRESRKFPLADDIWVPKVNVHTGEINESFMFASKTRRRICEPPGMQNMCASDLAFAGAQSDWPMYAKERRMAAMAGENDSNGDGYLDAEERLMTKAARDATARRKREAKAARQQKINEAKATVWDDDIEGRGKPNPFEALEAAPGVSFPPAGGMAVPTDSPTSRPSNRPTSALLTTAAATWGDDGPALKTIIPDSSDEGVGPTNATAAATATTTAATKGLSLEAVPSAGDDWGSATGGASAAADMSTTQTTTQTTVNKQNNDEIVHSLLEISSPLSAPRPMTPQQWQAGPQGRGSASSTAGQRRQRPGSASNVDGQSSARRRAAAGSRLHSNQQQEPGRTGSASRRRAAALSISPASSSLYSFGAARQWTGSRSSPAIAFPRAIRSTFADEAMHRRARDTTHYVRYADTAAKTGVLRFMNPTERPAFSREAPRSAKSASATAPPKPGSSSGGGIESGELEGTGLLDLNVELENGGPEGAVADLKISSPIVTVGPASPLASPQLQVLRAQATGAAVSDRLVPPPSSVAAEVAAAYAGADFGAMGSRGGNGNSGSRGGSAGGNLIIPFEGDLRTLDQITSIPRHVILSGFAAPMVDANSAVVPLRKAGGAGGGAAAAVSLKNTTLARVAALERRKALGEVVHFMEDGHNANSRVGLEAAGARGDNGPGGGGSGRVSYAANTSPSGLYEYVGGGKLQWFGNGGHGENGGDGGVTISRNGHVANSRAGGGGPIDFDRDGGGAVGDDASVSTCFVSLGQTSIRSSAAAPRLVVTNGSVSGGGKNDSAAGAKDAGTETEGAVGADANDGSENAEPEPAVTPGPSVVSLPSPQIAPNTPAGDEQQQQQQQL